MLLSLLDTDPYTLYPEVIAESERSLASSAYTVFDDTQAPPPSVVAASPSPSQKTGPPVEPRVPPSQSGLPDEYTDEQLAKLLANFNLMVKQSGFSKSMSQPSL
jgi:hypothetical protein